LVDKKKFGMDTKIKVVIADDHAILRAGLKQILAETDDMEVVAEAQNANEAIRLSGKMAIDVMLLDISMPDRSGMEALKYIKKENHQIAVLMLSMHREDQYAVRALKGGASGYLCKQSASEELVTAIRMVAKGKKYITAEVAEILANQVGGESETAPHESLSDREFQTLTMIASGLSVGEIAEKLSLSVKTVSMYRARLLEKMQLKHNAELTHYAIKNQLVD
jgi:two-component system invasion response regulator UvrY